MGGLSRGQTLKFLALAGVGIGLDLWRGDRRPGGCGWDRRGPGRKRRGRPHNHSILGIHFFDVQLMGRVWPNALEFNLDIVIIPLVSQGDGTRKIAGIARVIGCVTVGPFGRLRFKHGNLELVCGLDRRISDGLGDVKAKIPFHIVQGFPPCISTIV